MQAIGKLLIILGGVIVVVGVILTLARHIPYLGRLPGDLFIERGSFKIYFPITTSIVISIVLTILANLLLRR